jgi:nicotinamidase-related amidase
MKSISKSVSALLVMDVQTAIVKNFADNKKFITNIKSAIATARKNNIPVIYVMVAFRKGFPEINQNNKSFSMIKERSAMFSDKKALDIYPEVAPKSSDIVVVKRRVSAFTGSDLEVILRSQNIHHVILCGIATSGVVLSTIREAADKDYGLTVLSDCCTDSDEEVHSVLMTKIFPRQADVLTASEWQKKL